MDFWKKPMILCLVIPSLTGCLGNKTIYIPYRENMETGETKGVLRPVKRYKIKVFRDPGKTKKNVDVGEVEIYPKDVLVTDGTFKKLLKASKGYNKIKAKLLEKLKKGEITKNFYDEILNTTR